MKNQNNNLNILQFKYRGIHMSFKKFKQQFQKQFNIKKRNICSKVSNPQQLQNQNNTKILNYPPQQQLSNKYQQQLQIQKPANLIKKCIAEHSKNQNNQPKKIQKKLIKLQKKQEQLKKYYILENRLQDIKSSTNEIKQNAKKRKLKSLRKVKQQMNKDCTICLEIPKQPIGKLPCQHIFCYQCLEQWLKKSTKCPLCRKNCEYVLVNQQKIKLEKKIFSQNESNQSEDSKCYICDNGEDQDNLLLCDQCDEKYCHYYCDFRLARKPKRQEDWICHFCCGDVLQQDEQSSLSGFIVDDEQIQYEQDLSDNVENELKDCQELIKCRIQSDFLIKKQMLKNIYLEIELQMIPNQRQQRYYM